MFGLLTGWRGYAAAAVVAASLAGPTGWIAQGWRKDAQHAQYLAAQAQATVAAVEAARIEERRRTAAVEKARDDAQKQAAVAAADASAARVAGQRLRARIDAILADASSRDPALASGGAPTGAPLDLLAYMLRGAIDRAGQLAEYADHARIAGLTCERAYDGLTRRP